MLDTSNYGCINFPEAITFFDEFVRDAVANGGTVTIGGFKNTDSEGMGRFYEPTVIANVNPGMKISME
jgi:acyl-CoA reductase-like NAD-dependent aldehyde dehydrogenase